MPGSESDKKDDGKKTGHTSITHAPFTHAPNYLGQSLPMTYS